MQETDADVLSELGVLNARCQCKLDRIQLCRHLLHRPAGKLFALQLESIDSPKSWIGAIFNDLESNLFNPTEDWMIGRLLLMKVFIVMGICWFSQSLVRTGR